MIIYKIDIFKERLLIPIVEYEIYDIKNKTKLELDICKDTKIELLYPCIIEENSEYKYNSSNEYYNEICYSHTTKEGTDIILSDRRNEYVDNNMFLCEIDCDYNGYDSNIKKSKCECEIKLRFPLISEITINKDKLLNNFKNITSIINLKIMKCYKELFTKEGFKNNIGSHIILFIIFCNILSFIFFAIKDFKNLYIIIDELYLETKNNNKTPNTTIHDKRMQNIQKEEDKIIKNEVKNARICNNNKNNHINSFKGTNEYLILKF